MQETTKKIFKRESYKCFSGGSRQSENTIIHYTDVEIVVFCRSKYFVIGNTNKYLLKDLVPQTSFKFCYYLKLFRKNIRTAKVCAVYTEIKLQN